jgi:hypothetical protein
MKMEAKSKKPSFGDTSAINQHKALAQGKQGKITATKKPKSKQRPY